VRQARRRLTVVGIVGVLAWAGIAVAAPDPSSGKLTYTETIDSGGTLTILFDESSQKRFASVDYELDGTGSATWSCDGGQIGIGLTPSIRLQGLAPDAKGHVVGTFSVPLPAGGGVCASQVLQSVTYTSLTLTNLASGHVYRLDADAQTF
jgi:hypothetical protein